MVEIRSQIYVHYSWFEIQPSSQIHSFNIQIYVLYFWFENQILTMLLSTIRKDQSKFNSDS